MAATEAFRQSIQGEVFNAVSAALPATLGLALWDGDPGETGATGTEITGTIGLSRATLTRDTTDFSAATAASPSVVQNALVIPYGTATGTATASHFALFAGATLIWNGALTSTVPIASGNPVESAVGDVVFTLTDTGLDAGNQRLMAYIFNATALGLAADLDIALYNGDPGTAGTGGAEVTGTLGLTRATLTRGLVEFTASTSATPSVVSNATLQSFGTGTGVATVTHFQAFSGTDAVYNGALLPSRTGAAGEPYEAAANALVFSLS